VFISGDGLDAGEDERGCGRNFLVGICVSRTAGEVRCFDAAFKLSASWARLPRSVLPSASLAREGRAFFARPTNLDKHLDAAGAKPTDAAVDQLGGRMLALGGMTKLWPPPRTDIGHS